MAKRHLSEHQFRGKREAIIWHKFSYPDMLGKPIPPLTASSGKGGGGAKINLYTFISIFILGRKILSLLELHTTTTYVLGHGSCVIGQTREPPPSIPPLSLSLSPLHKHFRVIIRRYHMAGSHSSLMKNFSDVRWMVLWSFI